MYFIRVSWKYITNVEMEAEGGGGEGCECRAGACRPTSDPGPRLLNSTSRLWAYYYLYNRRVGKLRLPFLSDTLESLWSQALRLWKAVNT